MAEALVKTVGHSLTNTFSKVLYGRKSRPSMEKPMPFIVTNKDGKLEVNKEVEEILVQAEGPISTIVIAGKYRTGKSYLMNRFYSKNAGFSLGSTVQSETKGIWIWARPHPMDQQRTLVLLDTEGLSDVEEGDDTYDLQIFTLAILLSKCFVYNAMGQLDNKMIQELDLVTELTERIQIKGDSDDEQQFSKYFPYIFFVLRDFFLEMEIDNKPVSPDEYLEHALRLKPGSSKKVNEYNSPRQCIRNYFPERRCFTLCKPVQDEEKLRMLDKLDEKEIRPQFLDEAKAATDAILQKAEPMEVEGNPINGRRFFYLAEHYVKCIKNGAVPCVSSAVALLKNNECQKAMNLAIEKFKKLMEEKLKGKSPVEFATLLKYQKEAHDEAVACYHNDALFDKELHYQKKLLLQLEECFQTYVNDNDTASRKKCKEALQTCFKVVTEKLEKGEYLGKAGGYDSYKRDREKAVKAYKRTSRKGPKAEECLTAYLESKKGEEDVIIKGDKALDEKEKEIMKEKEERQRQEQKAKEEQAKREQSQQDLTRKEKLFEDMKEKMENDMRIMSDKMQKEKEDDLRRKEAEVQCLKMQGETEKALLLMVAIDAIKGMGHALERAETERRISELEKQAASSGCVIQ